MSFSLRRLCLVSLALLCPLAAPALAQDEEGANAYSAAAIHMETRLSAVEEQMRALTGKVEQVDFALRRLEQALQRLQSDHDTRLTKLESAPPPPQSAAQAAPQTPPQEEPPEDVSGTLGNMKFRGGEVTGGSVNPKTPPLPEKPADYGLTAQEQYDRAFGLLREADYDEAEKAFKGFLNKYPKDKLAENAKYWYAETFYVRGKFGDAAIAFADAYEQNTQGSKAPDALLKLALSLAAIDKGADACSTLSALKSKYPKAAPTIRSRADQERARLKCK